MNQNIVQVKQIITIDSEFRDNPESSSTTDFTITLPETYDNIIKMKLISTEIPNTQFIFHHLLDNNRFCIKIYESSVLQYTLNVAIPTGYWYSDDFDTFMRDLLDNHSSGYVRSLYYGNQIGSGKSYFRFKTADEIVNLSLEGIAIPSEIVQTNLSYSIEYCDDQEESVKKNALDFMGFKENIGTIIPYSQTYNYGSFTYNGYFEASKIYGIRASTYFFIMIDDNTINKKDKIILPNGNNTSNILARIQINNPLFTVIVDNNQDNIFKERNYNSKVKLSTLKIKILDKYGNVVDLNNSDISLSLELTKQLN
jgi:hypothetical protein